MNKRMRVTVFATCVLLMCLLATSALATTIQSTAYVDYGVTSWVRAGSQPLNTHGLYGTVYSYDSSTGTAKLRGEMWSAGVIFAILRGYKEVAPKDSDSLPVWSNPNHETGTFFARARASGGNHDGYCRVYQDFH